MSSSSLQTKDHPDRTAASRRTDDRYHAGAGTNGSGADHQTTSVAVLRMQAAVVALAPVVMLAGLVYHPDIGSPGDADFLARLGAAVNADPTRWAVAHLLVAVGSALIALAFLAVRRVLRATGEDTWSMFAIPFVITGSVLYALLPAMEFAPLSAALSGADASAAQAALLPYFVPTLFSAAFIFFVGACAFAVGVVRGGMTSSRVAWFAAISLVIMAASRFVPLMAFQMHLQSAAGLAAFWPLAYVIWRAAKSARGGS